MTIDNEFEMGNNGRLQKKKPFLKSLVHFMIFATPLSWIIAWFGMYRFLLFKRKEKAVVANVYGSIAIVIALIMGFAFDAGGRFASVFTDLGNFSSNWTNLIPFILVFSIIVGVIEGMILINYEAYYMKNNKGNVHDASSWKYQFKYSMTPWEKRSRAKKIEDLKNGKLSDSERAAIGLDVKNNLTEKKNNTAYMYVREAARQTVIFGATGSGKSITQLSMAYNNIMNNSSALFIDFKNSPKLAAKLATWTKEAGGTFYHFVSGSKENYDIDNSPGQSSYDCLATASNEAASEIILAMREWDVASSVYKVAKGQLTQALLNMLDACDKKKAKGIVFDKGRLYMLATATNKVALNNLVDACYGTHMQETAETLWQSINTRNSNPLGAYNELAGDMTTLYNSKAGEWLKTTPGKRQINLYQALAERGSTILFSFSSDTEGEYSKLMGSLLFGDLNAVSAARRGAGQGDNILSVYVDEFQVIPPSSFVGLLEKGRESGVAMTIASQSIEQVVAAAGASGDAVKKSLLDTCSNFIIHAGTNYGTAEDFSSLVGKEDKLTYTTESSNKTGPFRELVNRNDRPNARASVEKDWKLNPSDLQELSIPTQDNGFYQEAVLINKVSSDPELSKIKGATSRTIQLVPNAAVVRDDYYTGKKEEPDIDISQIQRENIAISQRKLQDLNDTSGFNMSEEDDMRRISKSRSSQNEFNSIQEQVIEETEQHRIESYVEDFETFEEVDPFEQDEIIDEESYDGGFGWDDDEVSDAIQSTQYNLPEYDAQPQKNIVRPEPKNDAPRVPQKKPTVRPAQPQKISAIDSLFSDTSSVPQSMKNIKQNTPKKEAPKQGFSNMKNIAQQMQQQSNRVRPNNPTKPDDGDEEINLSLENYT